MTPHAGGWSPPFCPVTITAIGVGRVPVPGGLAWFDLAVTGGAVQPLGMGKMGESDRPLTGIEGDGVRDRRALGYGFG